MGESDLEKTLASFDWRAITPEDSPKTPLELRDDPHLRDLSTPSLAPDDSAYDFELPIYDFSDGSEKQTRETFHLQKRTQERPVALIFGSYT